MEMEYVIELTLLIILFLTGSTEQFVPLVFSTEDGDRYSLRNVFLI
jgi:hypothetical protein